MAFLVVSLEKGPLVDFSKLLVRAEKYARTEEGYDAHVLLIVLSTPITKCLYPISY